MTVKSDAARIVRLRQLMYLAAAEGWSTRDFDAAMKKLYGKSRAPAKPK